MHRPCELLVECESKEAGKRGNSGSRSSGLILQRVKCERSFGGANWESPFISEMFDAFQLSSAYEN